jgi:phage-related tail protein
MKKEMTDDELIKEYVKTRIELQKYLNVLINRINNTLNAAETIIENISKKQHDS